MPVCICPDLPEYGLLNINIISSILIFFSVQIHFNIKWDVTASKVILSSIFLKLWMSEEWMVCCYFSDWLGSLSFSATLELFGLFCFVISFHAPVWQSVAVCVASFSLDAPLHHGLLLTLRILLLSSFICYLWGIRFVNHKCFLQIVF